MLGETEIVLYNPDNSINIEVRLEEETVWLNRQQMSILFGRDIKTIGKHISNALKEELSGMATVANFATVQNEGGRLVKRNVEYYNLDVIISVGYRVKSKRGIEFRQWANRVLKEFLLRGYAVNNRLETLERKVAKHDEQIQFFIKSATPIAENVFMDGEFYDAFALVQKLIKSAKKSIILIDNYVDESVLTMMSEKSDGVSVVIYTKSIGKALELAADKFNNQYGNLKMVRFADCHDRFLILDNSEMYLFGASLKDLGKKMFAFTKMDSSSVEILMDRIKRD
ncbi:MAG: virulence RhuM family protein [Bacteroidales bacterium]|nr:virulence RhuM family protein [Bacteroidales bacterium]